MKQKIKYTLNLGFGIILTFTGIGIFVASIIYGFGSDNGPSPLLIMLFAFFSFLGGLSILAENGSKPISDADYYRVLREISHSKK